MSNKVPSIIAIDGPAASGKSTIAKLLAQSLGYLYIDSGAMYRAVTCKWLEAKQNNPDLEDLILLSQILETIEIELFDNSKQIFINGEDYSSVLRTNTVSNNVSYIASFEIVRKKLVELQRKIATGTSVVMDGRDIGTVVFPQADYKFFMVASPEVRASRRLKELKSRGEVIELETLVQQIKDRDKTDSEREISPLIKASEAIEINTDQLSIEEVLKVITQTIQEKLG
jgi:CMP/dCMP kinase